MCCVVVLQNCVGFVEGETGSCNETHVECDVGGTEEFSIKTEEALHIKEEIIIKVEDAIDIKDETSELITFPTIKTEQEVRLWGVCVNCEITPNCFLLYVMFWVPYSFKMWIAILKTCCKS